ncbi:hypothetical protein C2I18_22820 [Paenibacillus sp. PK3_47]|uniref:hypothetical protein n=1 Tax=Paenibacillus sp. PK3_47 TaxID=2072642 RepID=UPI00201D4F2A|nr:hypothetical protein [Paenibacillus sp. PK3_47]UQZ36111.1 hypothetical protein C2I18_22820 [Paenibacillus sp. PK3_47]
MKIKTRQKAASGRKIRLLLLLCLGVAVLWTGPAFPSVHAATDSRVTVTQAVSHDKLSALAMKSLPSPASLQDFVSLTISKLSANAPFKDWKNAGTEYYPLGPGTHSWLVNVMDNKQRIGYLIITAAQQGSGYVLSEYGAGTSGLPYSLAELRQYLVQEELIPSAYSGPMELTAFYAPLLPLWQLVLDDETLYINASVPEVLPWSTSKTEAVLKLTVRGTDTVSSLINGLSPLQAFKGKGQDDPYADLQWLANPKLKDLSGDSFSAALLGQYGSVAFQSAGRNDSLGAPFMITGFQRWTLPAAGKIATSSSAVVYAASGPGGKRYLPLSFLQQSGTLHPVTLTGPDKLGAAPDISNSPH